MDNHGPLIAVDMDDVLATTNLSLTEWHNAHYGSDMTIDDFHFFHYWKNPHWGTPAETRTKLDRWHNSGAFQSVPPVPGAREGIAGLRHLGFRLVVVTARSHIHKEESLTWLDMHFPDLFEEVIFTSTFQAGDDKSEVNPWAGKSKAEVIKSKGALLLIDDSLENAMHCAEHGIPVLLFGDYPWSMRHSRMDPPHGTMSRAERIAAGHGRFWEKEIVTDPLPTLIRRVGGWNDVVDWVQHDGKEALKRQHEPPIGSLQSFGEIIVSLA